ncbi:hypothetical protein A9Q89_04260 [Gammaproteobacteria bacterium 53_120_T64]|nr:hypothetical protein A9Q89_04260 [Gammaproteobacteria bacterium 53_120_T64]
MRYFIICTALVLSMSFPGQAGKPDSPVVKADWERDFLLANLEFTLLHEFGHLIIEEFKLPVLGMEEDAADRLAIIVMMREHQHESAADFIPWLLSVAGGWYTEWELKEGPKVKLDYWDNHNLEIQRFHNIVCLIVGGHTDLLEDVMDTEFLPFDRAVSCDYEYKQARHALNWLQSSYGQKSIVALKMDAVKVFYKTPREGENKAIFELIKTSQVAEKWAQKLSSSFKFPRPISVEFDNCFGLPDAFWHAPTASVTICYELLSHFSTMIKYRREHSTRACGIPILRKYMKELMSCT